MTTDDNIRDEKLQYGTIREAKKYQDYHLEKLIKMNILQVKKYWLLIIEQPKLPYSPLGKGFEK